MKLINILIIFLLTITACFAEFGSEVIVDGTGIQTDDDAELNSLDVLLYVKSSTLEPHTANTPVVIKPETGSTTDDVLEIQSEDGTAITTFDNSGGLQVDNFAVGCAPSGVSGEARIGTILPCDDSSAIEMRLPSGSSAGNIQEWYNGAGGQAGKLNILGDLFMNKYRSLGDLDWKAAVNDDTKKFAFQDSSGSDAFTLSIDSDDRVMSFIGDTNTGTLKWDNGLLRFQFLDDAGQPTGKKWINDEINTNTIESRAGTGAPSATYGINYPEQTAPSAPSSGATLYTSSADGNLCAKRADGYQMCFGLPSFGKIFEENETGSAITITVAGTYYPWITAEDGTGTGSTGGNTITTSTGNPSSITIEENGDGFYQVAWHAGIDTVSGAIVHGAIFKNGSRILPTTNHVENATGATKDVAMSASTYVYLVENDVLTLQFTSDTNGDVVDVFHASLSCNRIAIEDNN